MYTVTRISDNAVVQTGLNRSDAFRETSKGLAIFHLQSDYKVKPKPLTYKYDKFSHDFLPLAWEDIRTNRNKLLSATDWRTTSDYPGSDQQEWLDYRKELRELPQKYHRVEDIVFPEEPNVSVEAQ